MEEFWVVNFIILSVFKSTCTNNKNQMVQEQSIKCELLEEPKQAYSTELGIIGVPNRAC